MTENESVETPPPNPLKTKFESRLWEKAEDLMNIREPLERRSEELYNQLNGMNTSTQVNLYKRDEADAAYRKTLEQIGQIQEQENRIQEALEKLDAGKINEQELLEIVPPEQEETEHLSKKKQRMKEERERLGIDPREYMWDYYREFGVFPTLNSEFGSEPTRLTTGRHQRSVHGNLSPYSAEGDFNYYTADTHGGKVPHGKRGDSYTTASGKRVRKY